MRGSHMEPFDGLAWSTEESTAFTALLEKSRILDPIATATREAEAALNEAESFESLLLAIERLHGIQQSVRPSSLGGN